MKVIIRNTYEEMSHWAAEHIIDRINAHNASPAGEIRPFVLGLPTGSSPLGVYRELVAANRAGRVSFKNVVTFNMDEYIGLPREHEQSYWKFMHDNLFDHIDIDPDNVNILNGMAADPEAECARYEDKITAYGGIDLDKVPKAALSVGVGTVMDADEVLLLLSGHNKARALRHLVEEPVSGKWTVSALQLHPAAIIACDEAACDELTVGTYKYFKETE